MSEKCDRCEWESGEETDGDTMPKYNITNDDVQVKHCPECMNILDTRENKAARQFAGRL